MPPKSLKKPVDKPAKGASDKKKSPNSVNTNKSNTPGADGTVPKKKATSPMKKGGAKKTGVAPGAKGGPAAPMAEKSSLSKGRKKKKEDGGGHKTSFLQHFYHKYIHANTVVVKEPSAVAAISALGLTQRHLKRLKLQFEEIDLDGSGSIDSDEFFEILEEARSPFTDALFALIDLDGSGTIEFEEYIMVCVTYCMYSKEDILRFCFECFDKDGSGTIDEKEYIDLCRTVNNAAPLFPGNFAEAIGQFDTNDDGLIDFQEFIELDRRYPLILFPAFRLQDRMQHKTLGAASWVKIHEGIQKQRRIKEYMEAHGGQRPPDPPITRCLKKICCCFYSDKEIAMNDIKKTQEELSEKKRESSKKKAKDSKAGISNPVGSKTSKNLKTPEPEKKAKKG